MNIISYRIIIDFFSIIEINVFKNKNDIRIALQAKEYPSLRKKKIWNLKSLYAINQSSDFKINNLHEVLKE